MRITSSAGEFEYVDTGDPGAPSVVLLHGLSGNSTRWDLVTPELCRYTAECSFWTSADTA